MNFWCDTIYFILVLLLGIVASACFTGIPVTKKNSILLFSLFVVEFIIQGVIFLLGDVNLLRKCYPLITHIPMILFFVAVFKCRFIMALFSVMTAYLCCQIPWWMAQLVHSIVDDPLVYIIVYTISVLLTVVFLLRKTARPVRHIMTQSTKTTILIGAVPFFYYCFDYITTVYTNWLYLGRLISVQFMPTVIAVFFLAFMISYYDEISKKEEARRLLEVSQIQWQQASAALANMHRLQEQTMAYRHDMRHHFALLNAMAEEQDYEKIQSYIQGVNSDIDKMIPQRYCKNNIVNLILSNYVQHTSDETIQFDILVELPSTQLTLSDTELCSLLSNALENAIKAAKKVEGDEKTISVRMGIYTSNLFIQVTNPYIGEVEFEEKIPRSRKKNHGYGTQNIANIVNAKEGQYIFFVKNGKFTVRILLPQ